VDLAELDKLVAAGPQSEAMADSAVDQPVLQVQQNALPDVYPDDGKKV
jgi:hypothetical protein